MAFERVIYEMLFNYEQDDAFWDSSMSGYSRDVCFRDYPNYLVEIDDIKERFCLQKDYAEKTIVSLLMNGNEIVRRQLIRLLVNLFLHIIGLQDLSDVMVHNSRSYIRYRGKQNVYPTRTTIAN